MEKNEKNSIKEVEKGNVYFKVERCFGEKSVQQIITEKISKFRI